jgi:TolB-like protein
MTRLNRSFFLVGIFLFFAFLFSLPTPSRAGEKEKKRIAFLPFEVHASEDLSYLSEGIRDMLASRLAAEAGVIVVGKAGVDQSVKDESHLDPQALMDIGRTLGADYLVSGSFTFLGGSVSLDASVYEPANPGPPQRFYATAASEGEVIRAVDQLSWNMAEKLFQVKKPPQFQSAAISAQEAPKQVAAPFQTAHPERAFIASASTASSATKAVPVPKTVPAAKAVPVPNSVPVSGGIVPATATGNQGPLIRPQDTTAGFTKTRNFDFGLQAFDVGDVDGDGVAELVLADNSTVYVYRQKGDRLDEMARIAIPDRYRIHWLSIADTNGNGRPEIYISAASAEEPGSSAVEWDGKSFVPLFKDVRWYIRAMNLPGEGPILLGQRPAVEGVFLPGLYRLIRKDGSLEKGQQLALPERVNLFDFNMADVNNDGEAEVITITQNDQLRVARRDGKIIWRSDEDFGGTMRYVGGLPILGAYKDRTRYNAETGGVDSKRYYVPSRILVADMNGDSVPDIIVNRNKALVTKVLKNLRRYTSGELYALSWNGVGMAELWHTRKIDGYIVDYQLQKGEKQSLLRVGLELGGGFLSGLTEHESTILAIPIDHWKPSN